MKSPPRLRFGVSGCVFVGDTEGYLYSVSSGVAGTVCTGATFALSGQSENLGSGGANEGIFDGPLVDPVAETVYVFVADSGALSPSVTLNTVCVPSGSTFICTYVVTAGLLSPADVGQEVYLDTIPVGTIATVNVNGLGGTLNLPTLEDYVCSVPGLCDGVIVNLPANLIAGENVVDEFTTGSITSGNTAPNSDPTPGGRRRRLQHLLGRIRQRVLLIDDLCGESLRSGKHRFDHRSHALPAPHHEWCDSGR